MGSAMVVVTLVFTLLQLLFTFAGTQEIYAEPIYNIRHYRVLQDIGGYQSNVPPFYMINADTKSGFRLRNGISDEQKAELSNLAVNSEPDQRRSPPFAVAPRALPIRPTIPIVRTTPQPWTRVSYRRYSGTPVNRTRPPPPPPPPPPAPPNYAWNFQTYPPSAYYGGYVPQNGFAPQGYVPVSTMVSAINKILSIVQKTVRPGAAATAVAGPDSIREITNFLNTMNTGYPEPIAPPTQPPAPPPPPPTATSIPRLEEKEEEELIDAEQVKGTPIRKAEEVEKPINPASFGELTIIGGDGSGPGRSTSIAISLTTTPRPTIDDGSNLLESLLRGRLDKVDWFGSLLGTNQLPTKEEGNAVAQIFQGGIFGPAS